MNTKQRIVLSVLYFIIVLVITRFKYAYGSSLDWCSQHWVFPDYFRKLFYDTGDFFPDFAANIGGGENIYDFSYYGLFSPIIMLSYLFPFIEMSLYIQIVSVLGVWFSLMLFHRFLQKCFSSFTALAGSLAFIFTSIYLFNSHRHIMFVCNMPFLIASLEAADKFILYSKKSLLIISLSLMILCSYYFSIPSIISVTVYAVYSYLKNNREFRFSVFFRKALSFAGCVITSVMISAVLLLPSLWTVLSGRDKQDIPFDFTILIPRIILGVSGISPQAFGLTVFGVVSIVFAIISGDRSKKFLGGFLAAINIFPVFAWLLNGGMYTEGKVLIPFIPLLIILIAQYFEYCIKGGRISRTIFIISGVVLGESVFLYDSKLDSAKMLTIVTLFADIAVFVLFFFLYQKKRKKRFLVYSAVLTSAVVTILSGITDVLMPLERMSYETAPEIEKMTDIIARDSDLVRSSLCARKADTVNMIYNMDYYSPYVYSSVHNKIYKDFYFETIRNENEYRNSAMTTRSSNILFNIFMGNKYLITNKENAETGYEFVYQDGLFGFYENKYALPVGRSSDRVISQSYFDSLSPIEQMEAIVKYIVVDDDSVNNRCEFSSERYYLPELTESNKLKIAENGYNIKAKAEFETSLKLEKPVPKDKLLVVFMDIDNSMSDKDARIKINNMRNTLTSKNWKYCNNNNRFEYVLTTDGADVLGELNFIFSPGEYTVRNIEGYLMDFPDDISLTGRFIVDKQATKGDIISGSINCEKDSIFELTVPYDSGFEVYLDGQPVDYSCVDKAFIGFEITEGEHNITIEYKAPLKAVGLAVSAVGVLILIVISSFEIADSFRKKKSAVSTQPKI